MLYCVLRAIVGTMRRLRGWGLHARGGYGQVDLNGGRFVEVPGAHLGLESRHCVLQHLHGQLQIPQHCGTGTDLGQNAEDFSLPPVATGVGA